MIINALIKSVRIIIKIRITSPSSEFVTEITDYYFQINIKIINKSSLISDYTNTFQELSRIFYADKCSTKILWLSLQG